MSDILSGFSDMTRLRILFLIQDARISVNCLVSALDLPQPTVSRHLCTLRKAGMIQSEKHGTSKLYSEPDDSAYSGMIRKITADYYQQWKNEEPFASDRKRLKKTARLCPAGCEVKNAS